MIAPEVVNLWTEVGALRRVVGILGERRRGRVAAEVGIGVDVGGVGIMAVGLEFELEYEFAFGFEFEEGLEGLIFSLLGNHAITCEII